MATVTMNMSDYTFETDAEYGEEVLNAGWNPVLALAAQEISDTPVQRAPMPADLVAMDVEQFMDRMYLYLSYE